MFHQRFVAISKADVALVAIRVAMIPLVQPESGWSREYIAAVRACKDVLGKLVGLERLLVIEWLLAVVAITMSFCTLMLGKS